MKDKGDVIMATMWGTIVVISLVMWGIQYFGTEITWATPMLIMLYAWCGLTVIGINVLIIMASVRSIYKMRLTWLEIKDTRRQIAALKEKE